MTPRLLVAAHGTASAAGLATTRALVGAIAAQRRSVAVSLCFLDVATPSLTTALSSFGSARVIVVPLLLSAGYHVQTDIPAVVSGRPSVRVAQHLGPDPLVISAVADRLAEVAVAPARTTVLAAIASSRPSARAEVDTAAGLLATRLGQPVSVVALSSDAGAFVTALPAPVSVAVYLLAEGGFLSMLRAAVDGRGAVAEPIGVHPALVSLVWSRYDSALDGRDGGRAGGAV